MTATLDEPRVGALPLPPVRRWSALVAVYSLTAALGSALLFLVEPMMARQLLPLLGGSAAVWNTAMVFFQGALLAGYLVAHGAQLGPPAARRAVIVLVLAAGLFALPLGLPSWSPPATGGQAWWVLAVLAVSVGLPFVGLATLGPTLQRWFADTDHPHASDPYFLYAAGNVGSVVGLVAYPVVVEPTMGLAAQRHWWSATFVLTMILCGACVVLRRRRLATEAVGATPRARVGSREPVESVDGPSSRAVDARTRLGWIGLSAVPSGLLLGVTRHLSTDVAAVPLLWVLPLLVYLATFVVAFRRGSAPSERLLRVALLTSIPLLATMVGGVGSAVLAVVIGLVGFALLAMVSHACLAVCRPGVDDLTSYYLWISFGGAVGGIAVSMVAPVVFTRVTEYPLLVVAALLIVAQASPRPNEGTRTGRVATTALVVGIVVLCLWLSKQGPERAALITQVLAVGAGVVYVVARSPRRVAVALAALVVATVLVDGRPAIESSRTFFGVYRVRVDDEGRHIFEHGTTIHGAQEFADGPRPDPLTYYRPDSGIGRVFRALDASPRPVHAGVVGLGAGTLASYGRPGDRFDFYEIDAEVVRIARDPRLFTFLRDSDADVTTIVGDGRLNLAASDRELDVLVLDAFSSDAIPVHLLTAEAMAEYRRHLAPGGVIAVHISNRYFDLGPIVGRLGRRIGMDAHRLETPLSDWVLLSDDGAPAAVRREVSGASTGWTAIDPDASAPLWTDDFSNLLSALH